MARAIDADETKKEMIEWLCAVADFRTIEEIIDEQPTIEPKQEWISVKDRLPEENNVIEGRKYETCSDLVIVFVRDDLGNSFTCDDMTTNGEWINYPAPQFEVTHWMPLPEPPEKNNEEEQA